MTQTAAEMIVESNVRVPMRDGVQLSADVYRPAAPGRYPVLVTRSPYGKGTGVAITRPPYWVSHGYVLVVQDCRSRFESEGGDYYELLHEPNDGYDTVEWAAVQPWSDGNVGAIGQSYLAADQYSMAPTAPPHLKAMIPISGPSDVHQSWAYHTGGALEHGFIIPYAVYMARLNTVERKELGQAEAERLDSYVDPAINFARPFTEEAYRHLPLSDWAERLKDLAPYVADYLNNPDDGPYWWRVNTRRQHHAIDVPAYHIGSWYDLFQEGAWANFAGIRALGTERARRGQKLLIGPWGHGLYLNPGNLDTGEADFGPEAAAIDMLGEERRWYDHWLKGEDTGIADEPPVRIFVMGENRWRFENEWPLARTRFTAWYLHSAGSANTLNGDGTLSPEPPGAESVDRYVYDPHNPVPTLGGSCYILRAGVYDQRQIEARPDVLVYTSEPLAQELEITGPIAVTLWAASSAYDTDFTAKLVDVWPDGRAYNLQDGIIRARYRDSGSSPALLTPGQPYRFTIDLWATSHVVLPGHRLRVEISSSNFPSFDRNPNTGRTIATETELAPAQQTILHDAQHPSCIILPVIPR